MSQRHHTMRLSRREFLGAVGVMLAGLRAGSVTLAAQEASPKGLPVRPLGKTGEKVSIIGLGGWDIGTTPEADAIAIMHEAIDNGLTFFDNCWDYHNGKSEEFMGKALSSGGRRDKVFLMSKVCGRNYTTAMQHLDDSLRRLQTDRLDLWQFHAMKYDDDAALIFAAEGAVKAALEAKQAGKVRYIGFTGHQAPPFHLAMLDQKFAWDATQMPINFLDAHYRSFQKEVLPKCTARKIGVIGMKSLGGAGAHIIKNVPVSAELCRRYSLSLPISTLVCGIQNRDELQKNLAIARNFKPLTEAEVTELLATGEKPAATGQFERYKVGNYGCDWYHNSVKQKTT